jgi:two-component system NtrC family response regulator
MPRQPKRDSLNSQGDKRVGGLRDIKVNVRIIATTNRDNLDKAVREGQFRADLYYRLKVFPILLAPLRKRKEDIIPLAMHHIEKFNNEFRKDVKGISDEAQVLLLNYPWHGNAREVRNVVERICILENTDIVYPEHLPAEIIYYSDETPKDNGSFDLPNEGISLKNVERDLISQALQKAESNQTKAAKLLGISRDALRYKMQKFGLM